MIRKIEISPLKCKELLVRKCSAIDEKAFNDLISCTREIKYYADKEKKEIHFFFRMKIKGNRYPTRTFFDSLIQFQNSSYRDIIKLNLEGYSWNNKTLSEIIGAILEKNNLSVNILSDTKIEITNIQELDKKHYAFLNFVLGFLFQRKIEIFADRKDEQSELKMEMTKKTPREEIRPHKPNLKTGDYCCFKLEKRANHSGQEKYKAGFTDLKNFYWASISNFSNENKAKEIFDSLQIDKWYTCTFSFPQNQKYVDFYDAFLHEIAPLDDHPMGLVKKSILDSSEFGTSVSVCSHTKNSVLDGLYTAEEFIKESAKRGQKAFGVTDLGSVQSFPSFHAIAKKEKIKALYGVELEIVNQKTPILMGGHKNNWLDVSIKIGDELCRNWDGKHFCILDIETTGLYPNTDEIIQINIRKILVSDEGMSEFQEIDELNQYIKINGKLNESISSLTNITDEKLQTEGVSLIEALEKTKKFIKDSIIVCHNGIEFDIPFINAHLRKNNIPEISETVLDTLRLSHYLFEKKNFKSHALSSLAKKTNSIDYDEQKAHDAKYDTHVLYKLFFEYLVIHLKEQTPIKLSTLKNINECYWKDAQFNISAWGCRALIYSKNQKGIENLYKLVSIAHTQDYCDGIKILRNHIDEETRKNLIVVSSPINGELFKAVTKDDFELFSNIANWYDYAIVPPPSHFIHELERDLLKNGDAEKLISQFINWCKKCGLKWFFNGFVKYMNVEIDQERYSILVNTKGISGKRHYLYNPKYTNEKYPHYDYKYTDELFNEYKCCCSDEEQWKCLCKESIENNKKFIAEIEDNLDVLKRTLHSPKIKNCDSMLKKLCEQKMKDKYGQEINEFIKNRYEIEMKSIIDNNFSVVYWVSHMLVKSSIKEGYLVGSRGSVGSSFIAYLSGISEVNPLVPHYYCQKCSIFEPQLDWRESGFDLPEKMCEKCGQPFKSDGHDIPFETFLGFGGDKIPDIDLNFSGEYQLKAHEFLMKYFGEDQVFRVGTINTIAERTSVAVVQDYEQEMGIKFNKGKKMWLSDKIVDVKRTTGQHPGGILVVPENNSVYEFSPVNYPANDKSSKWKTTHFTFEDLHDSLLKFDILGHDDPTTLKLLKELTNFDPMDVPNHDPQLIELYRSYKVLGIEGDKKLLDNESTGSLGLPEFGTSLTRKIISACQPKTFADLMRISGFSHGTGVWKKNIELLIKNQNYPLNSVITCRDDIMLYLIKSGIDRKEAFNITESIRKGKGVNEDFEKIMKDHNIPKWYIESAKKISYIFPKAHATAYVIMSWKIAYYKLYHPLAFYSAYFTTSLYFFDLKLLFNNDLKEIEQHYIKAKKLANTPGNKLNSREKGKLVLYEVAYEFLLRGFKFMNVCVNKSELSLFIPEGNSLRIPLMAVDGLGENLAKGIIKGRKNGFYRSIYELESRGGLRKASIEKLKIYNIIPKDRGSGDVIFDENGNLKY